MEPVIKASIVGSEFDSKGSGIINTISISNTMKIIPRRKNRRENGIRALFLGSNPHSNGEVFSRSDSDRDLRNQAAKKVAPARSPEIRRAVVNKFMN